MQSDIFENMPVPRAILKSAVPTIVGMLVVLIYNIADTYFVGQIGDPMQVAAVSLTMPVFLLFMATGNLIGIGGTSVISRALGARRTAYAKQVSSFCFYASLGAGVIMAGLFLGFMPLLLRLIGASPETSGFAREYLLYVSPSAPFVILSTVFNNIVRAEGKAKEAMNGMLIGTIVNIVLDPFMILVLGMGRGRGGGSHLDRKRGGESLLPTLYSEKIPGSISLTEGIPLQRGNSDRRSGHRNPGGPQQCPYERFQCDSE